VSFLLRHELFSNALTLTRRLAMVFAASDLESSMCKAFLTITVIQLTLGDFVQVRLPLG